MSKSQQPQPPRKPSSQPRKFTVCPELEKELVIRPFPPSVVDPLAFQCRALAEGRECINPQKGVNEYDNTQHSPRRKSVD